MEKRKATWTGRVVIECVHLRKYLITDYLLSFIHIENHDKYEGMWMNDLKEGPGRYYYRSRNQVYQGEWALDIPKCGTLMVLPVVHHQQTEYNVATSALPYVSLGLATTKL